MVRIIYLNLIWNHVLLIDRAKKIFGQFKSMTVKWEMVGKYFTRGEHAKISKHFQNWISFSTSFFNDKNFQCILFSTSFFMIDLFNLNPKHLSWNRTTQLRIAYTSWSVRVILEKRNLEKVNVLIHNGKTDITHGKTWQRS